MKKQVFLQYPCGKKISLLVPIVIFENGAQKIIYPSSPQFFAEAKKKFELGKLKVIEEEVPNDRKPTSPNHFVSLARKMRAK